MIKSIPSGSGFSEKKRVPKKKRSTNLLVASGTSKSAAPSSHGDAPVRSSLAPQTTLELQAAPCTETMTILKATNDPGIERSSSEHNFSVHGISHSTI